MKKTFYIIALGLLWFLWITFADVNSLNIAPTTQSAISGSLVTFTVTWTNTTGDVYLKYILPNTANYSVMYQNATMTPLNVALLTLGIEHDPLFLIPANSNFSVTVTGKMITTTRAFPLLYTTWLFATDMQMTSVFTSAIAQILPVSDLLISNILTWFNPISSGDIVSYYIVLQNIWSDIATGITFISTFPIPTLGTPIATFNNVPYTYTYINYPQDFVWTWLNNLNPWTSTIITLSAPLTQNFPVGTPFSQIAKTTTITSEYTTGNNSATATGSVTWRPDLRVTKTFLQPRPSFSWDKAIFVITYGNSWYTIANGVMLHDTVSPQISRSSFGSLWSGQGSASLSLWNIPAGSGGTIIMTGYLNGTYPSPGTTITNTVSIDMTGQEITTWNNYSTVSWWVISKPRIAIDILANNLSKPQMDTPPYWSWSQIMIQAVSGDIVKLTMNYINTGNTVCYGANITLAWLTGFTSYTTIPNSLWNIPAGSGGTLLFTWIVGPKNFTSFTPKSTITCGEWSWFMTANDQVKINEPLVCGDGMITQTEQCDPSAPTTLYSGQSCDSCMIVTHSIINSACINYQYTNSLWWISTGQACDSANLEITNPTCNIMTWLAPTVIGNNYSVNLTCKGDNTTPTTPITIDCRNGHFLTGFGSSLNGTCTYASSFVGAAQCDVAGNAPERCRVPISIHAGNCESLDARDGTVALVDENGDAESRFRCTTVNGATAQTMTIDCWNDTYHTEHNVSVLNAVCRYTNEHNIPKQYPVKCTVDGVDAPRCQENLIIDEGKLWYCGDGIREWYENCDDGDNNWEPWYCTKWCDVPWSAMVGCFNIGNTNISIQKSELLPFRWTLDNTGNIINGNSCNGQPDGKIPSDTIKCFFKIYNGDYPESNGVAVDSFQSQCNENARGNYLAFKYFLAKQNERRSLKNAFGKYYRDASDFVHNTFWEYKIVLDKVSYQYCRSDGRDPWTEIDRVCSVNFTVTQPYLAQKSSFGLTPRATTISLDGYKMIDGTELIRSTDLADIMVLNASTYDGGNSITTMMDKFITKYKKLAIKYTTIKSEEQYDINAYKVPGKNIVVFKGTGTLVYTSWTTMTEPFTVIVDWPNLKINGSIEKTNAMFLVNRGNITFMPSTDACIKTDVIKGIFVTNQWSFTAGPDLTNKLDRKRCAFGWLKVQGVLIGDGIEDLVTSRRSQLNGRFYVWWSSEASIKSERRNEIFNGASVLIEYSPSLWSALPPGASEFTKALDVYKQ